MNDDEWKYITDTLTTFRDYLESQYVSKEIFTELDRRVTDLERDRKKVIWFILAAILTALLSGLFVGREFTKSTVQFGLSSEISQYK